MMQEKRGLSAVIATILLVLLSISAVTIIAAFIIPFVNRGLEGTGCFEFMEYFKFDDSFGFNCYEENGGINTYIVTVKPQGDKAKAGNIDGFGLRFMREGGSINVEYIDGAEPNGEIQMYNGGNIGIPSSGGEYSALTYKYIDAGSKYTKVEIYPILKGDKICDISDSMKLSGCS